MGIPFKQWFLVVLVTFGFILVAAVYESGRRLIYQALFRLLDLIVKDETDTEERQLSTRLALFLAILCLSVYSSFLLKLAGSGPTQQIVQGIVASTLKLILIVCVGSNLFALLNLAHRIYSFSSAANEIPLKGVVQVIKIGVLVCVM